MSYNTDHLRTAGKITVYTALVGVLVFAFVFILNIGSREIHEAKAQSTASTTVTVLNTPPVWTASSTEAVESSADNPTNAGDTVSWEAIGTDSNSEDYWLLICNNNNAPTATSGGAPTCNGGIQWAVSATTTSGTEATAATTTASGWSESNVWYGWICDGNSGTPRCSTSYSQGTHATNSSPFIVNHRPAFTIFSDDSAKEPGQTVIFSSTASDTDSVGVQDTVKLFVCSTAVFNTVTDTCTATTLASTTAFVAQDATSTYTIVIPTQDQDYNAYGFVIDNHGFEASGGAHGTDSTLSVSNVAPTVGTSTITLNGGLDMTLSVESNETTGFALSFIGSDNNSCENLNTNDEMQSYAVSIYRNGTGVVTSSSSTCSTTNSGHYNANRCYTSAVATTTWDLSCTASTTSCTGSTDTTMQWDCTFPLWYVADPTDGTATSTQYNDNDWRAQVQVGDDGQEEDLITATSSASESGTPDIDVTSFLAFALNTISIPYGSLEPGSFTDPLTATTTISATGNVGLDKTVQGTSMCTSYTNSSPCLPSATSTIPESEQVFATSSVSYSTAEGLGSTLSSTTAKEIELNVQKSTTTSTQASADAYWGIRVPGTITFAGNYTGENTFYAIVGESANW